MLCPTEMLHMVEPNIKQCEQCINCVKYVYNYYNTIEKCKKTHSLYKYVAMDQSHFHPQLCSPMRNLSGISHCEHRLAEETWREHFRLLVLHIQSNGKIIKGLCRASKDKIPHHTMRNVFDLHFMYPMLRKLR